MRYSIIILLISLSFSTSQAERDWVTRISNVSCVGGGHNLNIEWDTAHSPYGPKYFKWDGKDISGGMNLSFREGYTIFENRGLKFRLDDSDEKANFKKTVDYMGKKIPMDCSYTSRYQFFRKRQEGSQDPVIENEASP